MQLHRTIRFLAVFAIAGVLAAGCGGEASKGDYEREVNDVNTELEQEFDKFQDGTPTKAEMERGADIISDAADDLDDIDPPDDVKQTHEDLVGTIRKLGESLRVMAPALEASGGGGKLSTEDEQALVKAQEDSQDAIEGLQKAQEAFTKAGYDIELGAGSGGGGADASGNSNQGG